jgi:hypothetical protein
VVELASAKASMRTSVHKQGANATWGWVEFSLQASSVYAHGIALIKPPFITIHRE